jgi:hypothetical protein
MDFLRMEGENNFLSFLPPEDRRKLIDAWYQGLDKERMQLLYAELHDSSLQAGIRYTTKDHKAELLKLIEAKLETVRSKQHDLDELTDKGAIAAFHKLERVAGPSASVWPEATFIQLQKPRNEPPSRDPEAARRAFASMEPYITVLRDSAHSNVAELFSEDQRRTPNDDGLTVLRGIAAAYPNLFLSVDRAQLDSFVEQAKRVRNEQDMGALRQKYEVARASPALWPFVDELHEAYWADVPIEAGLMDLSRLDPGP